eukprot:SAG22_NODE_38_length_26325_cov_107.302067_17_plen_58_part_00
MFLCLSLRFHCAQIGPLQSDIRVQLPEDSKRFDGIDGLWKEMMKEAIYESGKATVVL